MTKNTTPPLPAGILPADLLRPEYKVPRYHGPDGHDYAEAEFEIWYTAGFGWVIPTLDIAAGRNGQPRRTYAVAIKDRSIVRVGQGPHVTATLTVYVTTASVSRLLPFLDLRREGMGKAGDVRDRISTRRMQGRMLRDRMRGW